MITNKFTSTKRLIRKILQPFIHFKTLGDPLDNRYIHLKVSEKYPEAGEGAFAKENVPKNVFYAVYGGRLYNKEEYKTFNSLRMKSLRERNIRRSDPEIQDIFKYRLILLKQHLGNKTAPIWGIS